MKERRSRQSYNRESIENTSMVTERGKNRISGISERFSMDNLSISDVEKGSGNNSSFFSNKESGLFVIVDKNEELPTTQIKKRKFSIPNCRNRDDDSTRKVGGNFTKKKERYSLFEGIHL